MPLDPQLLKILACPKDHASLTYKKVGKKETLVCKKCQKVYQIKNGIPLMMPQDA